MLQQAEVRLVDKESCNLAAYHGEVTEKMLCAGLPQGGVDTCQVGFLGTGRAGWSAPLREIAPVRGALSARGTAVSTGTRRAGGRALLSPCSEGLSFAGGQRRAPALLGGALAGGGHRQLGPGLRDPQHTRCLHQRPRLPQLDLRRPEGQCCTVAVARRFGGQQGRVRDPSTALHGGEPRWQYIITAGTRAAGTSPFLLRPGAEPAPSGHDSFPSGFRCPFNACNFLSPPLSFQAEL